MVARATTYSTGHALVALLLRYARSTKVYTWRPLPTSSKTAKLRITGIKGNGVGRACSLVPRARCVWLV